MSRLRALAATLAAALLTSLVAAAPATAATNPELLSLSVAPTAVTPPGVVEIAYRIKADTATLSYMRVTFAAPQGSRGDVHATLDNVPLEGTLRWKVPDGLRNATYQLAEVQLGESWRELSTTYRRDGTRTGGGTHDFDFPSKDVTISGSNVDLRGPLLSSVRVTTPSVRPGQPLTVQFTATEEHQVAKATFTFTTPGRPEAVVQWTTDAAELAAGRITRSLPAELYNKTYTLTHAELFDSVGNFAMYWMDGKVQHVSYDSYDQVTEPQVVDRSAAAFTVAGSTYDKMPPVLRSISVDRRTLRSGQAVKATYAVQDDTARLGSLSIEYSRGGEQGRYSHHGSDLSLTGSYSDGLGVPPGRFAAERVRVVDGKGNEAQYWRDGTVRLLDGSVTGRHAISLSSLDLVIGPNAPTVFARSRPRSAAVTWSVASVEARGITGYKITVNPGGRVIDVPGIGPDTRSLVVTGLKNATPYTFTVVPQSSVGPGPGKSASATPLLSGNVFAAGDVNGDRRVDLIAQSPNGGERLYRGKGSMTFSPYTPVSNYGWSYRVFPGDRYVGDVAFLAQRSWDSGVEAVLVERDGKSRYGMDLERRWPNRFLDGSADFTGDGVADMVGVTPAGSLYLYRSTSMPGSYSSGVLVGRGWQSMQSVFAAGDMTGDRRADLLGVDAAGVMWVYPGTGKGTFPTRRKVCAGWGGLGGLFYARDVSGDGRGDIGAITMDGKLRIYKGRGNGTVAPAVTVGAGWASYL